MKDMKPNRRGKLYNCSIDTMIYGDVIQILVETAVSDAIHLSVATGCSVGGTVFYRRTHSQNNFWDWSCS